MKITIESVKNGYLVEKSGGFNYLSFYYGTNSDEKMVFKTMDEVTCWLKVHRIYTGEGE